VKLEEEDLGTRYRKNMEQKKLANAGEGLEIEAIQSQLKEIEQTEQAEKEKLLRKDEPVKEKKRVFDLKAIQEAKKKQEEEAANERIPDPLACKLTGVPSAATEEDIRKPMSKFGVIDSIYIPPHDSMRQNKIAIVRYKQKEHASRAVEEKEITIEFSAVTIERAIQKAKGERKPREDRPPRTDGDRGMYRPK
jgi:RNA recognition motif-containing protein